MALFLVENVGWLQIELTGFLNVSRDGFHLADLVIHIVLLGALESSALLPALIGAYLAMDAVS